MLRAKPNKNNKVHITSYERDKIIMTVKKKLFPLWAALFITATKDVLHISRDQMQEIIKTANRYAGYHTEGKVNVYDFKKTIEKDLGESLENILRCI